MCFKRLAGDAGLGRQSRRQEVQAQVVLDSQYIFRMTIFAGDLNDCIQMPEILEIRRTLYAVLFGTRKGCVCMTDGNAIVSGPESWIGKERIWCEHEKCSSL